MSYRLITLNYNTKKNKNFFSNEIDDEEEIEAI